MRVLLDGIVFTNDHQRGVQRYFRNLLEAMGDRAELDLWLRQDPQAPLPKNGRLIDHRHQRPVPAWNIPGRLRRKLQWKRIQERISGYQLFHSTFFTGSPIPGLPEIVTVHDMIVERYPQLTGLGSQEQFELKKKAIARGRLFIAVSQTTADELASFYPQTAGRIRVIYPGMDHVVRPDPAAAKDPTQLVQRWNLEATAFVLYVGDRFGYKNFALLPEAMTLPSWPRQMGLLVAGPAFTPQEQALLDHLGLSRRVAHVGRVDDRTLGALYGSAAGVVCPSLLEGFGLPPIEAQIAGTPALCSDVPIFHETTGKAALFFDPRRPDDLAQQVGRLLDPALRRDLAQQGQANAQRFTWSRAAQLTLQAYEEVSRK